MDVLEERIQLIAKEIEEANANPWTITKIIKELNDMETKSEAKLRQRSLVLLRKLDPNASKIYEAFSKMKVYTSKETIENFNRGHIIQSLIKETSISRSVAEKITQEVEEQIKDAKINFLTTGLIRELVNAKLTLYGFEKIRNEYTRVGFPVYELKKKIFSTNYNGAELKEYNFLGVIDKEARKLHYNGTIYIEDAAGFSHRPFAYSFLAEKYDTIDKTILKNTKKIINNSKYFSTTANIRGLSHILASFLTNEKLAKQVANKVNDSFEFIDDDFCNYLELFTPSYLEEYEDKRIISATNKWS
jgi:hypothetical protein